MSDEAEGFRDLPEWEFWFGVVFFLATLVGIAYLTYGAIGLWRDSGALPVQQLLIHGERHYVSDEEVRQKLLAEGVLPSLTSLDVDWVQQTLAELPWVDWVTVRKEWPSQLHVYLAEYRPVARWNASRVVSDDGRLFTVPDVSLVNDLPFIDAPDDLVEETLALLQAVNTSTQQAELQIKKLAVSARQAWQIELTNGIELRLGREQRLLRFERFLALLPKLQQTNQALPEYVDLRYDTGAAVRWPEQDN